MNEETRLNQQLYEAIITKDYCINHVEKLLKQGANPLGYLDEDYRCECAFEEMLLDASDYACNREVDDYRVIRSRLSELTDLFLEYGMLNRLFYDEEVDEEYVPLRELKFLCCREGAIVLKKILDAGYNGESLWDFLAEFELDIKYIYGVDFHNERIVLRLEWWGRMLMLIASYAKLTNSNKYIRDWAEIDDNEKSLLERFRDFDAYTYDFGYNTDRCEENPCYYIMNIKDGNRTIWKTHF